MFGRYNIASLEDKLEALKKASAYAATRARVASNVVSIETRKSSNGTSTRGLFAEENGGPRGIRRLSKSRVSSGKSGRVRVCVRAAYENEPKKTERVRCTNERGVRLPGAFLYNMTGRVHWTVASREGRR
jgi:hypothetical protein